MAAKYQFATGDVLLFVAAIKQEFHPRLRDNRILVVWREDQDFGHTATCKVLEPAIRFLCNADAIIFVHRSVWEKVLNEKQKAYHIDHALASLFATDKYADDGRPKLTTVQAERIGFSQVIKRHGVVTEDVKHFRTALEESNQLDIFDLMASMDLSAADYEEKFSYQGYKMTDAAANASVADGVARVVPVDDESFLKAARLILQENQASVSLLQRKMKIGYSAAALLIDALEKVGFVGPFEGSKPRAILVNEDSLKFFEENPSSSQVVESVENFEQKENSSSIPEPPSALFTFDEKDNSEGAA